MKRISLLTFLQVIFLVISAFSQNTVTGTGASTAGSTNTIYGYYAGDVNTGGSNSFFGDHAGASNTDGSHNVFIGKYSGYGSTTGSTNTFIGSFSGQATSTGAQNFFGGAFSGYSNTTGNNNTFIGRNSGYYNTTGSGNVAMGSSSWAGNQGSNNVILGFASGPNNTLSTASNNVIIGYKSGQSSTTGTGNVFLGSESGYNETGSNKLYIDNSNTTTPLVYGDFNSNQVGINSLPNTTHALTVGGTLYSTGNIYATGIYVNGNSITDAGFEFWNKVGTNIWNRSDNVGIGVDLSKNPNNYRLGVKGKIGAQEVQIENNSLTWSDFVFKDDYKLITLEELEHYIKVNKHLPEIPTEAEVRKDGLLVSEMNAKLLQKVEELTLYVIELKKEVEALKKKGN